MGNVIPNTILASIGLARKPRDPVSGFPLYVDLKTLQGFKSLIQQSLNVSLDHSISVASGVIPSVGTIDKNSVKIISEDLVGDYQIDLEAFLANDFLNKVVENGEDAMMSLESFMTLEIDEVNKLALLRPIVDPETQEGITTISLVQTGAITRQLHLSAEPTKTLIEQIRDKLNNRKINNNIGENTMSDEAKKEPVKATELSATDPKPAIADAVDKAHEAVDKSAVDAVKEKLDDSEDVGDGEDENFAKMSALHNDMKATHEGMKSTLAEMSKYCASLNKATLSATKEETKPVSVVKVEFTGDVGDGQSSDSSNEPSDEELAKNVFKIMMGDDTKAQNRLMEMASRNQKQKFGK